MSMIPGEIERIHDLDQILKEAGATGILIGGVARAYNITTWFPKSKKDLLPRKDLDIMVIRGSIEIPGVDVHKRFTYDSNWDLENPKRTQEAFPYWANRNGVSLDVTFPNIDSLELETGLHVPDYLFLTRMIHRPSVKLRYNNWPRGRLPKKMEDVDSPLDTGIWKAKAYRWIFGDPEGVISMDVIKVRPITNFEKGCIIRHNTSNHNYK